MTVIYATPVFLSGKGVTSDISLFSNQSINHSKKPTRSTSTEQTDRPVGRPQRIPTPLHTPWRHGLASTVALSRLLLNLSRSCSRLRNDTVCACSIFTVETTKLWNLVQKKKFARGEREWGEANASGERRMRVGRGERKWNLKEVEREWGEPARERGSANRVRRLRVSVATLPATVGILFCTEMACGYLAIRSWSTGPTLSHPQTLHIQPSLNVCA